MAPLSPARNLPYTATMQHEILKKIPNGKLIRLKIDADETINQIKITGDFFLYPEESIEEIEKNIAGIAVNSPAEIYAQRIHQSLAAHGAAFIGVTTEDIANAIAESLNPRLSA